MCFFKLDDVLYYHYLLSVPGCMKCQISDAASPRRSAHAATPAQSMPSRLII